MNTHKTRAALTCGAIAGPLFTVAGLTQAATRAGFDPAKHQLSLLSNGSLGWVQMLNFIITGGLFLTGAMGMRATLTSGRGSKWGPRLIAAFGPFLVGSIAASGVNAIDSAMKVLFWVGVVPLLGVAAMPLVIETKGRELED